MTHMKRRAALFAFVVLATSANDVIADHVCTNSPNEVLVGYSPAGNGVASAPICRWVQQEQAAAPQAETMWEMIEDRFGALALGADGVYATSSGRKTRREAEDAALALCEERGGNGCRLSGTHRNSCSTFAWGGGKYVLEGDVELESSERIALSACEAYSGVRCRVVESFCSKPISRWVYSETQPPGFVPKQ